MIVRSAYACETCSQPHTTRIGLGQEPSHTHRFACRGCGEEIVVQLNADVSTGAAWTVPVENATEIEEVAGAPIVNMDANFIIPVSEQGKDSTFPRLQQMMQMVKAAEARGAQPVTLDDMMKKRFSRPFRSPDYADEWKILKRAWTLHRNNKPVLSAKKIEEGSAKFYSQDSLNNLQDWVWRLGMFMTQPTYEPKFKALIAATDSLMNTPLMTNFLAAYPTQVLPHRGKKYFDIFDDFFTSYSEFAQVFFLVTQGVTIRPDHQVTSTGFNGTKMFYGNAFERFAPLAELYAFLNNMIAGREWDQFEKLTLVDYRKLDRANVFNAFASNAAFAGVSAEADNQVRNASHHGSMRFDPKDQIVRYKVGKGAQGEEQTLSYTNYLERCVRLFLQTLTLLRFEVILCQRAGLSTFPL
jgi:DNA-directed RNA polymerase subunit RPC12/RpoP